MLACSENDRGIEKCERAKSSKEPSPALSQTLDCLHFRLFGCLDVQQLSRKKKKNPTLSLRGADSSFVVNKAASPDAIR